MDIEEIIQGVFNGTSKSVLDYSIVICACLIIAVAFVGFIVSIFLAVSYIKFNRKENFAKLTGAETARIFLDKNGLQNIAVKTTGSLLFGNSYSHYFHKVRLRRFTRNKTSISALAMGAQKSCLAILDKEGDKDMKRQIRLVPLITFGPIAFIPFVILGVIADLVIFHTEGIVTAVVIGLMILFYTYSIVLCFTTLKTEKKAQEKACKLLSEYGMATNEEIKDIKELFKLYNIEYVNNIIMSVLELIYYILQIFAFFRGDSSSSRK